MKKLTTYWPWLFVILLLALIAINQLLPTAQELKLKSDNDVFTALPTPKPLTAPTFVDQKGQPFQLAQLQGHWSILFFGYTSCPDVCPVALGVLKRVYELAPDDAKPQVVLVSVDPQRDTPNTMQAYLARYHPSFIGLMTSLVDTLQFTKSMGVYVKANAPEADANSANEHMGHAMGDHAGMPNYTVDHTNAFFLLNPQAELVGIFSPPHNAEDIAITYHKETGH